MKATTTQFLSTILNSVSVNKHWGPKKGRWALLLNESDLIFNTKTVANTFRCCILLRLFRGRFCMQKVLFSSHQTQKGHPILIWPCVSAPWHARLCPGNLVRIRSTWQLFHEILWAMPQWARAQLHKALLTMFGPLPFPLHTTSGWQCVKAELLSRHKITTLRHYAFCKLQGTHAKSKIIPPKSTWYQEWHLSLRSGKIKDGTEPQIQNLVSPTHSILPNQY